MLTVKTGFIVLCILFFFSLPPSGAVYFVTKYEVDQNVFVYIGSAQFSNGLCINILKLECLLSYLFKIEVRFSKEN